MKSKGPQVEIKVSCTNCKFLIKRKDGEDRHDIPDGLAPLLYSCKNSNKEIGYLSSIGDTPDWCEFKLISIQNFVKKFKPIPQHKEREMTKEDHQNDLFRLLYTR